jgi:hypothetical protein
MIFPMKTARNYDVHHICHHFPKHLMAPWPGFLMAKLDSIPKPNPDPLDPLDPLSRD